MHEKTQVLDLARQTVRGCSLNHKTETAYLNHIRNFLDFLGECDLSSDRAGKINRFLEYLEHERHCAASTRNQARAALLFLYGRVFGQELSARLTAVKRVRPPEIVPDIFTAEEAVAVLNYLHGAYRLAAALIYGAGLRLSETVILRVRDLDFTRGEIVVRDAETAVKQRATMLPAALVGELRRQLVGVEDIFADDLASGVQTACLPETLRGKYPGAQSEFGWQYVFPAQKLVKNEDGQPCRRHLTETTVERAVGAAIRRARIIKKASCQTLRRSFAARLVEKNCDLHRLQSLLGHRRLQTTLAYAHLFDYFNADEVQSPLDLI